MIGMDRFSDTGRTHFNTVPDLAKQTSASRRTRCKDERGTNGGTTRGTVHGAAGDGSMDQRNIALMLPHVRRAVELTCDTVTISVSGAGV